MIKLRILEQLGQALHQAAPELNQLAVDADMLDALRLERPRNADHGDYAVNVSFLARHTKMAPPKIAEILQAHLNQPDWQVSVAGGYLNFKLQEAFLARALTELIHHPAPGANTAFAHQRMLLEYVSANPTGPLHIGHGRWAALGDSIVRILRHCGALVTPEFYINDAGVQMRNIAWSVILRALELLKQENALQNPERLAQIWGDGPPYPGDYVVALAQRYLDEYPQHRQALIEQWNRTDWGEEGFTPHGVDLPIPFTRDQMLAEQQALLEQMRVRFDNWISEKAYLYDRHIIEAAVQKLREQGYTYESEGALWFKSTAFGDEKDRVLQKSDGSYTYLTPDIAYHDDKYNRPEQYNCITNIWGADHHGYIARMRGAITALGHNPEHFEVLLGQLVNLIVDGERTRMGKRRKMLTLQDVVDEVGVDATRFWMVSKSADTALDFDVALAASSTADNPVFYVQYAHARCCSILHNAVEAAPNVDTGELAPPYVQPDALKNYERHLTPEQLAPLFTSLSEPKDRQVLSQLVLRLDGFEDIVRDAARLRSPHLLCQYMLDISASFHSFYGVCRILTPDPEVTQARLMLIRGIQKVLRQALELIGVSAPERM